MTVSAAALDGSGEVVTLTTSALAANTTYILTLNGIKDANLIQGTIAANTTTVSFTILLPPTSIGIRFEGSSGVAMPVRPIRPELCRKTNWNDEAGCEPGRRQLP